MPWPWANLAWSLHLGGIRRHARTQSRRLITRRSQVQILPPLLERRSKGRLSLTCGDRSRSTRARAERRRPGRGRSPAVRRPPTRSTAPSRSAKSLLEPRVVAYGGEVVVSARVLAEPRKQLDGPPEVGERVVAGVARERCEARVVVMQARVVRHVLEATADRFERVGVALFAVGPHGLSVERPGLTPVEPLVRLAGCGADGEDGSVPGRLPPRLRPDEHECSWRRVDRLAVDLEGRLPVEHDVKLFLA